MKKFLLLLIAVFSFATEDIEELKKLLQKQNAIIENLKKRVDFLENEHKKKMVEELDLHEHKQETKKNLPNLSLILNSSALYRDISNDLYKNYSIPGFIDTTTADIPYNANKGFNFNYAEFNIHSVVDDLFDADAIFHISQDSIEIAEAYVKTIYQPLKVKIKAGKFKSDFGYINRFHQHRYNFTYIPLIYENFFGPEGLNEKGIGFLNNVEDFTLVGELLQGENEQSFGSTSSFALFNFSLKHKKEFEDFKLLSGISFARGKNDSLKYTDIYGVYLVLKNEALFQGVTWQSEFLYRNKELTSKTLNQSGFYTEFVLKFQENIGAGLRYGAILKNEPDLEENLDKYSAMVFYKPSANSRVRFQYLKDRSKLFNGVKKDIDEFLVELNIAIGTHFHQE
ncbi:hypothetical protein [Nitrosophilus labii]|uniref:hypothetical protein n=1 Tax=Nitrosophilus labii TaxID=2706014 RepID=UPI001656C3A6|nr:hypothetical protein [Nitrosophilus labii]